jgi:hypothetical protein
MKAVANGPFFAHGRGRAYDCLAGEKGTPGMPTSVMTIDNVLGSGLRLSARRPTTRHLLAARQQGETVLRRRTFMYAETPCISR